jgi:hypothetical protein
MARMNDSKIDKGIQAVNLKLNELKGQKENIEESCFAKARNRINQKN